MSNIPAANTAPARTVPDSVSLPKLRRTLDQYANCTPAAVSGGSQAQMSYFVEDAKHDIAALVEALREAQAERDALVRDYQRVHKQLADEIKGTR